MGTVRVDPDRVASARPAMERMVTATRAEDGCLAYAYAEDLLDPGLIHVAERWRDRAALDAHFASPHMAVWRQAGTGLGLRERALRLYDTDEGQPL